jgi:hypothetical protein
MSRPEAEKPRAGALALVPAPERGRPQGGSLATMSRARPRPRALAIVMLAAACSPELVTRPGPPPVAWASLEARPAPDAGSATATPKEHALADAYVNALASAGCAGLSALIYEDAHFSFAGARDAYGRLDIVHAHDALFAPYSPRSFAVARVLRTDSAQAIEWTLSGVHQASGRPVAFRGLTLLTSRDDGTIADVHLYFDEAVAQAQAGAGPAALRDLPPAAPPGAREEVDERRSPEEKANLATLSRVVDALENDEAAYVAAMSDDVEVHALEGARPARGKAAARATHRALQHAIARLDTQLDNAFAAGPYVVVEYHLVGEQRAPLGVIPVPADPLIKMYLVDVAELVGGKITRLWRYDDPLQVGSSPEKMP